MAPDSDQMRRRVKAARALAGLSTQQLADRINQKGLGERTLRELEGESGRPFRTMELHAIAIACGLPYEFFTIDFARLPIYAAEERMDNIPAEQGPEFLTDLSRRLAAVEAELGVRDSSRATKQAYDEALDAADAAATAAADQTRDEGDASREEAQPPGEETPGSAGQIGG